MSTVRLCDLWAVADARLKDHGMDTPEAQERMRNKGAGRTEAKRRMLTRINERARAAGLEPLRAD